MSRGIGVLHASTAMAAAGGLLINHSRVHRRMHMGAWWR
jgi:hypothetical protein